MRALHHHVLIWWALWNSPTRRLPTSGHNDLIVHKVKFAYWAPLCVSSLSGHSGFLPRCEWLFVCVCQPCDDQPSAGWNPPHVYKVAQTSSSTAIYNIKIIFVDYLCKIRASVSVAGTYFPCSYKYRGLTHGGILKLGYCCFYLTKSSEHVIHCWQQSWLNYQPTASV